MKTTVGAAMAGVSVLSLCEKGDAFIMAETGKIFKKEKDMKKGTSLLRSFFSLLTIDVSDSAPPPPPLIHSLSFTGIAFPTCVSVNNCVCHHSPLKSDPDVILKDGDLVKM